MAAGVKELERIEVDYSETLISGDGLILRPGTATQGNPFVRENYTTMCVCCLCVKMMMMMMMCVCVCVCMCVCVC